MYPGVNVTGHHWPSANTTTVASNSSSSWLATPSQLDRPTLRQQMNQLDPTSSQDLAHNRGSAHSYTALERSSVCPSGYVHIQPERLRQRRPCCSLAAILATASPGPAGYRHKAHMPWHMCMGEPLLRTELNTAASSTNPARWDALYSDAGGAWPPPQHGQPQRPAARTVTARPAALCCAMMPLAPQAAQCWPPAPPAAASRAAHSCVLPAAAQRRRPAPPPAPAA